MTHTERNRLGKTPWGTADLTATLADKLAGPKRHGQGLLPMFPVVDGGH